MDTSQYNYFIHNEPNFQTLNEWEKKYTDLEDISNEETPLKPIDGLDMESDFLNSLKNEYHMQGKIFSDYLSTNYKESSKKNDVDSKKYDPYSAFIYF